MGDINIKGIDKLVLLKELWTNSNKIGCRCIQILNPEKAQIAIENGYIDFLLLQVVHNQTIWFLFL